MSLQVYTCVHAYIYICIYMMQNITSYIYTRAGVIYTVCVFYIYMYKYTNVYVYIHAHIDP